MNAHELLLVKRGMLKVAEETILTPESVKALLVFLESFQLLNVRIFGAFYSLKDDEELKKAQELLDELEQQEEVMFDKIEEYLEGCLID